MKQQVYQHHSQRSFEEVKNICELEQIIETRNKQLQNQAITDYLIKWKNLPVVYLIGEDEPFIHMHPQLSKR